MSILSFKPAETARMQLTAEQEKQIRTLYEKIAKDIQKQAKKLPNSTSGVLRKEYLNKLKEQINEELEALGKDVESSVTGNMKKVAEKAVECNKDFLKKIGMPVEGAFSNAPGEIVKSVATGQLYDGNWSLSKAIWRGTKKAQEDINTIVAQGIAQNKGAYDIAKDLEKYVKPSARKPWDWNKVYPGTAKKVDYNAQRLARTMVSHAYQQSFVNTTQKNPFVSKYKWMSAGGSHVCEICSARNGNLYNKTDLPIDHPNGMCTYIAVMEDLTKIADRLADWVGGKSDPALDEYAKYLGYTPAEAKKNTTTKKTTTKKAATHASPTNGMTDAEIDKAMSNLKKQVTKEFGANMWATMRKEFSSRPREVQDWVSRYQRSITLTADKNSFASLRDIHINLSGDSKGLNGKRPFTTFYHELGHVIDHMYYKGGTASSSDTYGRGLYSVLEKEYKNMLSSNGKLKSEIRSALLGDDTTSGIQDIISGMSKDSQRIRWGHSQSYWTRKPEDMQWSEVTNEAMAHFNAAFCQEEVRQHFLKYFPESYDYYVNNFVNSKNLYKR